MAKTELEIVELVCLGLIAVLTLTGNCLVILAFIFGPRTIRTYTNYFVVNLAVSDLMVGSLSLPFWMVFRADKPLVIASNVYKYFIAVDILCGTASILSLAAISVERMFAVKFPAIHFNMKSPPVFAGIIGTWVAGLIFTGSKFAVKLEGPFRIYTATIFTLAFLVPLIVIIISYVMIFVAAKNMIKATTNQSGALARELHIAKTISVIIFLFVFFWMPFFVLNMVFTFCDGFCNDLHSYRWLIPVSKMMHYSNSMMNFFVYAVRSPDFRRSFKAILFKCDTSSLTQRVRTISESIVTRGRAASDRMSFLQDNNNIGQTDSPTLQHLRNMRSKLAFKQSRLSNHSYCTEISTLDDTQSNISSSASSTNPLLYPSYSHACALDVANHSIAFTEEYVSSI